MCLLGSNNDVIHAIQYLLLEAFYCYHNVQDHIRSQLLSLIWLQSCNVMMILSVIHAVVVTRGQSQKRFKRPWTHLTNVFSIAILISRKIRFALVSILKVITKKICTWHDSCAVVACAKICCHLADSTWITVTCISHRITNANKNR